MVTSEKQNCPHKGGKAGAFIHWLPTPIGWEMLLGSLIALRSNAAVGKGTLEYKVIIYRNSITS